MAELWQGVLNGLASPKEQEQLEAYYRLLVEWNERLNLTAITDPMEVAVKHFWDSLSVLKLDEQSGLVNGGRLRVADVGTGAGLPGIPLAVCRPQWQVVLFDSLNKRLNFLRQVVDSLGLRNVELVHGRAEDLARDPRYRNGFDLVVSRAVARLRVLAELTVPFCRAGGRVVAYKGPAAREELADAGHALRQLKARLIATETVDLPLDHGSHVLVVLSPTDPTPKQYPRKAGVPQKQPL